MPRQVMGGLSELMGLDRRKKIIEPLVVSQRGSGAPGSAATRVAVRVGLREVPILSGEADDNDA